MPHKRNPWRRAEARAAYVCLIPSIIGLACITYLPMLASFALSLFDWNGLGDMKFMGLSNYIKLFAIDSKFYGSLISTVKYAVLASMVYALLLAMLLNRKVAARGFFRAVFYLPYVLPAMAVYLGWKWLFDYNHGFINYIISLLGATRSNSWIPPPWLPLPWCLPPSGSAATSS